MDNSVKRGDIFYADLSPVVGSEQGGVRPVLIVQNDTGNRHSPTVIAAAITSQTGKAKLPTHISLAARQFGLPKDSVVLLEQIRTLDKKRLREHMGRVCMDLTMVDVTDIPGVIPGDEAVLYGDAAPVEDGADRAGTIQYELLCDVSPRVPRVYLD